MYGDVYHTDDNITRIQERDTDAMNDTHTEVKTAAIESQECLSAEGEGRKGRKRFKAETGTQSQQIPNEKKIL